MFKRNPKKLKQNKSKENHRHIRGKVVEMKDKEKLISSKKKKQTFKRTKVES